MAEKTKHLPEHFQFSQGSLQAFVDCPRLFQLRYIERLAWPALEVDSALENERYLQLGSDFHRLVQQYLVGIPAERLTMLAAQDEMLLEWWRNFLDFGPDLTSYAHFQEIKLSAKIRGHRLMAKYDLIGVEKGGEEDQGSVIIYDWKTSRKLPKREWQEKKLQTHVYPYLLVKAGKHLHGGQGIPPNQIEMVYWFSNFPTSPLKFAYSQDRFETDEKYLSDLIGETKNIDPGEAPKTENEKRCRFCVYRSLCNRGIAAGPMNELERDLEADETEFELDFEQIAEIEF